MRSSWIWVGPKSSDKSPYKGREGKMTEKKAMQNWKQKLE